MTFAAGLLQTLALWLLVLTGFVTARGLGYYSATVGWVALASGLTGALLLRLWHWRNNRPRVASGALAGMIGWPAAFLSVTAVISVAAMVHSE